MRSNLWLGLLPRDCRPDPPISLKRAQPVRVVIGIGLNRAEHDREKRREHDSKASFKRKHRAEARAYYYTNRERVLARLRARRAVDKGYREIWRRYYRRNRLRILARRRGEASPELQAQRQYRRDWMRNKRAEDKRHASTDNRA